MAGCREENAFGLRCFLGSADMHLEAKLFKCFEDKSRPNFKIVSGDEGEGAIVYVEHAKDVKKGSLGKVFCWMARYSATGLW